MLCKNFHDLLKSAGNRCSKKILNFSACILLLIPFLCTNCDGKSGNNPPHNLSKTDSLPPAPPAPAVRITYHPDSLKTQAALTAFLKRYDAGQQHIILALNRLSPDRYLLGKRLIIPDSIYSDWMLYNPFPLTLDTAAALPKLIVISERIQAFAAYENGKLVRWGPTSTGRQAKPTPNGLLYTNYKSRLKISTVDGDWKMPWYFNISNYGGIGMHQYTLPGYPASHSCVRLLEEDAIWIFNWADQWQLSKDETRILKHGTPVIVFGHYAYGERAPWMQLNVDPDATKINAEELEMINNYIGKIR